MNWLHDLACIAGGIALVNSIPHTVSGLTGRAFQTPFAKPPGEGLSSSTVNVVWGAFNLAVAYALLVTCAEAHLNSLEDVVWASVGGLVIGIFSARHFGKFHGGNLS